MSCQLGHRQVRKMQPEIQSREWRRDTQKLPDNYADSDGDERDGHALVSHQHEHDGRDRHAKPELPMHQPDAQRAE